MLCVLCVSYTCACVVGVGVWERKEEAEIKYEVRGRWDSQGFFISKAEALEKVKDVEWKGYHQGQVFYFTNGDLYDGEWGVWQGKTVEHGATCIIYNAHPAGLVYRGAFRDGECHGPGGSSWLPNCESWTKNKIVLSQYLGKARPYKVRVCVVWCMSGLCALRL